MKKVILGGCFSPLTCTVYQTYKPQLISALFAVTPWPSTCREVHGKAKVSQIQHQEQVLAKRKERASNFK